MPIEIPRGLPFSVDTWTAASKRKRHHFLTHAHKDHLSGIAAFSSYPIYCTRLTKSLVLHLFPQLEDSWFWEIEVGVSVVVKDPDGDFSVTAFDANHCPGAAMFLFEGEFGNILHTGDCRLNPECAQNLPMKYISRKGRDCQLDYLFLDCTFGRCNLKIPNKQLAIQQVINCIWKHPNAPVVHLACDLLGQEDILVEVSKTFGSKIYVDELNSPECFHVLSLIAPEILSKDSSSRFQLVEGFPNLNERASKKLADARANFLPEPIFVRPSAQWYATNDQAEKLGLSEAVRDEFGVWHVCYSMHSSQVELEWALQLLQPKWVISTTPPCRAMELDYVKKNCYKTHIAQDDPIWKLFNASTVKRASLPDPITPKFLRDFDAFGTEVPQVSMESNIVVLKELPRDHDVLKLDMSPPPAAQVITLFGRARLGEEYIDILLEEKEHCSESSKNISVVPLQEVLDVGQLSLNLEAKGAIKCPGADLSMDSFADQALSLSFLKSDIEKLGKAGSIYKPDIIISNTEQSGRTDEKKCKVDTAPTKVSDVKELKHEKSEDTSSSGSDLGYIGSSKNLNASLRKLYRSMNVPVPRPLPSLLELMNSAKRIKTVPDSSLSKTILFL